MSYASAYEQYMLELINRARASAGVQPLAFNALLNDAAEDHSAWMLNSDIFSHTGVGGSTPGARMVTAGYGATGTFAWAENVAWRSLGGASGYVDEIDGLHTQLMNSTGHRTNLLNASYKEIGVGYVVGEFQGWDAGMVTQNFGAKTGGSFLTGVAFTDKDADRFYDVGEGLSAISITAVSSTGLRYTTTTAPAGGYQMLVSAGTYTVTFSGASITTTTFQKTVGATNVKLDLIGGTGPVLGTPVTGDALGNELTGSQLAETISGLGGADDLSGLAGNDSLYGGTGLDTLDGGVDADRLAGGTGNDLYIVDNALDLVVETSTLATEIDTVQSSVSYTLRAYVERLTLTGSAETTGTGNGLRNLIVGNDAANSLQGLGGRDTLDGGAGSDTAVYREKTLGVSVTLNGATGATVFIGGVAEDIVRNVENVTGGSAADRLTGDGFVNTLVGNGGADALNGRGGADVLTGGTGRDSFVFLSLAEADDTITDFTPVDDTIRLDNAGFGPLVGVGTVAQAGVSFVLGTEATSANETVIYDALTGQLFFDANGTGGGGLSLIATLTNKAALTSADILFV